MLTHKIGSNINSINSIKGRLNLKEDFECQIVCADQICVDTKFMIQQSEASKTIKSKFAPHTATGLI